MKGLIILRINRTKGRILVFTVALIIIAAIIAGYFIYKKCEYEYKIDTHPLKYSEFIEYYAENGEYKVDKYLLYAIVKTESGFDKDAVSNVGARGLMQIMEDTFDWIQFRLGEEDVTAYDDMFEPEINIKYGEYLFGYLYDKFGDVRTAAAAYHSGAACVQEWLGDERYSEDGKTLKDIPTSAASHYAYKIEKAYNTYKELYDS